jgi:hypothetical protein
MSTGCTPNATKEKKIMNRSISTTASIILLSLAALGETGSGLTRKSEITALWVDPTDLESRNLIYGPGGQRGVPRGTEFTFVKEDTDGTSPKYFVTDPYGLVWKIKLGREAQTQIAAARLLWAAGYHTHQDYFLPSLRVSGVLANLVRGRHLIGVDGTMRNASLRRQPKGWKKVGNWKWRESPFAGTPEFNGLRVMMAIINNWDVKDANTAIYRRSPEKDQEIYMVSDLGATFGTNTISWNKASWKGNLDSYQKSRFIISMTPELVNFAAPSYCRLADLIAPVHTLWQVRRRWIGKGIPREDAQRLGQLLARLSPEQIRDAFRAAGYGEHEVEGFARVVESRIAQLGLVARS